MSGSQQDQHCHSNADLQSDLRESSSNNNYYCDSYNKKVGSLWHSQTLDSLLDECEEKYGLRNAHPGYQMSQSHQSHRDEERVCFNNVNYDSDSASSTSFPESPERIGRKIIKYHESFRKVAKLLRNLQAELKERKDFIRIMEFNRDRGSCLTLNDDGKQEISTGSVIKSAPSTDQIETQWIFSNKRFDSDMIAKSEGSSNASKMNATTSYSSCTTKTKTTSSTTFPSVCPKGNKAEDEIPTARESSVEPTKSEMTRESVKNSSNSRSSSVTSTSRCISPIVCSCTLSRSLQPNNNVTLTGEVSSSSSSPPPVPVQEKNEMKEGFREHKMSSGLLHELLGNLHNDHHNSLNVEGDNLARVESVEVKTDAVDANTNNILTSESESELEAEEKENYFITRLFLYFLGFSVVALKALLATFDLDEEDRVVLCEKVKEAQFKIGTVYGEPYIIGLGGQSELMLTGTDLGFV